MTDALRAQLVQEAMKMEGRASPTDVVTNIWPFVEARIQQLETERDAALWSLQSHE